jgi:hypothetical protein
MQAEVLVVAMFKIGVLLTEICNEKCKRQNFKSNYFSGCGMRNVNRFSISFHVFGFTLWENFHFPQKANPTEQLLSKNHANRNRSWFVRYSVSIAEQKDILRMKDVK